jgi:hypothetical protein
LQDSCAARVGRDEPGGSHDRSTPRQVNGFLESAI